MAIKPIYADYMAGCSQNNKEDVLALITQLSSKIDEQQKQIQQLTVELENKVNRDELITIYSLEDEALFKAYPITGEEHDGS